MLQRLLLTTAIVALALTPALAQESGTGEPTVPPPEPLVQDQPAPDLGADPAAPPAEMAEEQPPMPPPAEAIIAEESATDMRAEKLIGTSVYNTEGQEVGTVRDIVFDQDGKIVGVVLKVGGFLGMGGKSVGIAWDQVKMSPDQQVLEIGYSGDELRVAPDFKTQEAIQAEREAEMLQQQQQAPQPQ
jgi:sporulation protein YlmC with PRC-barrel domain